MELMELCLFEINIVFIMTKQIKYTVVLFILLFFHCDNFAIFERTSLFLPIGSSIWTQTTGAETSGHCTRPKDVLVYMERTWFSCRAVTRIVEYKVLNSNIFSRANLSADKQIAHALNFFFHQTMLHKYSCWNTWGNFKMIDVLQCEWCVNFTPSKDKHLAIQLFPWWASALIKH